MNYIRHLNAFFSFVRSDQRLACSHVSLYLALFQYWNFNRFQNPFPVYRNDMMQLSKIGSKNTYHKCIKELHQAGYIIYNPPVTKFQPVRIRMIRLDIKEPNTAYKQLDLFSTGSDTVSVPNLTDGSTNNDTHTVPKMGQNIKDKQIQNESKQRPLKIFNKNEKIQENTNSAARVPIVGQACHPEQSEGPLHRSEAQQPSSVQVEDFFHQQNYPATEAKKFYNHYKAIGWKIKGITPIEDWHAAAHKWMLNTNQYDMPKSNKPDSFDRGVANHELNLQTLYKKYQAGENIFRHISPAHFEELNLKLTDDILTFAKKERINQLTGSNQNSILRLLNAYLDNKENDPFLAKDQHNLLLFGKRIAVLAHFNHLKQNISKH